MKRIAYWLCGLLFSLFGAIPMAAQTPNVVPIGNAGGWQHTALWLTNISNVTATQEIGTRLEAQPNGEVVFVTHKVTLASGETRYISDVNKNFPPGNQILAIEPEFRARVFLQYFNTDGKRQTAFESNAIGSWLTHPGTFKMFDDVRVDANDGTGAFVLVLNTNTTSVDMTLRLYGPVMIEGHYPFGDQGFKAPPGISLVPVVAQIPEGGHMAVYVGSPAFGGTDLSAPVYLVGITGPTDGGTQSIRY